jgi:hypothetical protein
MRHYLELLKLRAQIILLVLNLGVACANIFIVTQRLDTLGQKMLLYCRTVNFTDTICQEQ